MGNNKIVKKGAGCRCGAKSGGYRCGPNCNKKGGRETCGTNGVLCGPADYKSADIKDIKQIKVRKGGRTLRRKKSHKKGINPRNKTKKGRRKRRTRKGGVWPFNHLFGSNNNNMNSQNQYPENNVALPPMQFDEPQPNITRPHTPSAVGRPYGSYGPIARRNNRRRQAQPPPSRQPLTQAHQYQLEQMNQGANQFSGPVGKKNNIIKVGNTEAEVRKRINKTLGTLDIYMGRIFERQLQVNCNERGHTLYMNTLYVFIHHIIQILLTPKVTELAQMLIGSSSNFIGNLLLMIKKFFSEQVASTGEINESFLVMVSWFIRTMGSGIKLAIDLSQGPVLFSNFVIAIMKFLQETTINMTTTTIMPLGVFIYLVFNTFVYSYMKVLNKTEQIIKYIEPIIKTLGIQINNVETMTADELKDSIRNSVWDHIVKNSPVDVVLRRDVLDAHIARICQSAINHDYVLWMLQTAFGEPVSRQSPMASMAPPIASMAPPMASMTRPMAPPMASMAPPMTRPMTSMAPPMTRPMAPPRTFPPPMAQRHQQSFGQMPPMAQHTPYPTHSENNQMNSYDYDRNYDELNKLTVRKLQSLLKKEGLDQTGKKQDLIDRLLDNGWSL